MMYFFSRYCNVFLLEIRTFARKCSQIGVVHVHVYILSKIHPAGHNDANGINPEVIRK